MSMSSTGHFRDVPYEYRRTPGVDGVADLIRDRSADDDDAGAYNQHDHCDHRHTEPKWDGLPDRPPFADAIDDVRRLPEGVHVARGRPQRDHETYDCRDPGPTLVVLGLADQRVDECGARTREQATGPATSLGSRHHDRPSRGWRSRR